MCGRYYIAENDPALDLFFQEADARARRMGIELAGRGEIFPSQVVPVLAPNQIKRETCVYPMRWGFKHPSRGILVFNARSETAREKPFYVSSTEDRRCVIPASRYYEWRKEDGKKIKYAFECTAAGRLFIGGLYIRSSSEKLPCFSILTTEANDEIRCIHKRMPLLIPEESIPAWLSNENRYEDMIHAFHVDVTCFKVDGKEESGCLLK